MYENTNPIRKVINYGLEQGFSWVSNHTYKEIDFMLNSFKSTDTYFTPCSDWQYSFDKLISRVANIDEEVADKLDNFIKTQVPNNQFIGHCFESLVHDAYGDPIRKLEPDEKKYLKLNKNLLDNLLCGKTGNCPYMKSCAYKNYIQNKK